MSETPETVEQEVPAAEAPAPKPKRTRKKAEATPAAAAEATPKATLTAAEEAPAPKRRGRKKATPVEDAAETPAAEAAETLAEAPAPKRRGRKKAASAEDAAPADKQVFDDVVPADQLEAIIAAARAEAASDEESPAPKRRGRKKATPVEEAPVADAAAAPAVETAAAEGTTEEAPAPKRRGRKKATPVPEAAAAEQAASVEQPAEEQPAKAEEAPEQPKEQSAEQAAADAPAQDDQAERPARRKRERKQNQNQNQNKPADGQQGEGQMSRRAQRREEFKQKKKAKRERNKIVAPKTSREELEAMKVVELRAKATELGVDHKGLLKAALVDAVYEAAVRAEGFVEVEGVLDLMPDGFGFVRTKGYLPSEGDAYVHASVVRKNGLRKGDLLRGTTRPARQGDKFPALQSIASVNGKPLEELAHRPRFADLTPVFPDERLVMEHGKNTITARVIDLCAPIGKGQRGLIVSPPKAGKTTVLKNIAAAITANNPEVHLMCLLVDERPEEVTDMQRSIHGEVIASTFDQPCENHIACAEMVIERAKRLVEDGEDVVILLDSLTRLARAYNLAQPASGRILSGGVDSTALYPPKKFLGAARNIEGGGSLTILASALVETGSKMDEVIFEEFKGTGNMELKLDRQLADRRIFPAIDPVTSGTRREDLLLNPQEAPLIWAVRRILANRNNTERAMDMLIKSLHQTRTNQEFLVRAAKKAQGRSLEENIEF